MKPIRYHRLRPRTVRRLKIGGFWMIAAMGTAATTHALSNVETVRKYIDSVIATLS